MATCEKALFDIHWKKPVSEAPKSWHIWLNQPLTKNPLEESLGFPDGTLHIIDEAFQAGLNRRTGWDLSQISPMNLSSYCTAAKVYKRGVTTRGHSEELNSKKPVSGSYPICILDAHSDFTDPAENHFVVTDRRVMRSWPMIEDSVDISLTQVSEFKKSFTTVAEILEAWRSQGKPSQWTIIGGGITTDLGAFAASLVGAEVTLVPTSLLAMVDACTGGKSGANLEKWGKNQVGAFHFPKQVVIWPRWLETVPNFKDGAAECLKHAFLKGDKQLALQVVQAITSKDIQAILSLLESLIKVKADVVTQDPFEQGVRAALNLGHTLAHGLETVSSLTDGPVLSHNDAVAIGLVYMAVLSNTLELLSDKDSDFIFSTLEKSGCLMAKEQLSYHLGDLDPILCWGQILQHIKHDKKRHIAGPLQSEWILLKKLGELTEPLLTIVDDTVAKAAFEEMLLALS
ncbi:MAG: 3-dehydroquinate synthase family protein [Oligoflexales bacterium]